VATDEAGALILWPPLQVAPLQLLTLLFTSLLALLSASLLDMSM
jgi:hypothetical protein